MRTAAAQAGRVTALTIRYARALVEAARSSPEALRLLAREWDIPEEEWTPLLADDMSPQLWDRLAGRALAQAGIERQPSTKDRGDSNG
jgi:hypothetical protein